MPDRPTHLPNIIHAYTVIVDTQTESLSIQQSREICFISPISSSAFFSSIEDSDSQFTTMQTSPINYASSSSSSSPNSPSHSSITLHSLLASSTDSSSSHQSSSFPSSSSSTSRCIGLNLLVKAIHQITAGSVVGVPYIQRRIITRRRRPINFNNLIITTTAAGSKFKSKLKSKTKTKRQRRANMTMPSKYRDSVLQPLTPKRRTERSTSSIKIIGQ